MKVAAIQMTSGPEVPANLEQARALLEDAAGRGARLAALPENFSFMGLKDADQRAVAEADGSGAVQDFLAASARRPRRSQAPPGGRTGRPWCAPGPSRTSVTSWRRRSPASIPMDARLTATA